MSNRSLITQKLRVPQRASLLVAGLIAMSLAGCNSFPTHLHDPARLELAQEVRDEMTQYRANAPDMYAAMLENLERFKLEEDWLIGELAANSDTAFTTAIPTLTGAKLDKDRMKIRADISKLRSLIRETAKSDGKKETANLDALSQANRDVQDAKNNVAGAKESLSNWNAQVALFQNLIAELSTIGASVAASDLSFDELLGKLQETSMTEISYKDADGKDTTKTIADVVGFFDENRTKEFPASLSKLPTAPGLSVELANVGLELATIQQKRALAELAYLKQRANLMEDTLLASQLAEKLLEQIVDGPKRSLLRMPKDQYLLSDVARFRAQTPDLWGTPEREADGTVDDEKLKGKATDLRRVINSVSGRLIGLRYHAIARAVAKRQIALHGLELARLAHQQSIVRSKLADEAWQALVGTGLESLIAYHRGGLKPEHVANFLRLAQAAALIAIAS